MNEKFEQGLRKVAEVVKQGYSDEEFLKRMDVSLEELSTLLQLFGSQKGKQKIMDRVHEKLRAADNGEKVAGFTNGELRPVGECNNENQTATVTRASGQTMSITLGELLSDGTWGVPYELESEIPREVKKKFILIEAKRRIIEVLNDQFAKMGSDQLRQTVSELDFENEPKVSKIKRDWIAILLNSPHVKKSFSTKQSQIHKGGSGGLVMEKIVETFFEINFIDRDFPVEAVGVDVYEDNVSKADLMLLVPSEICKMIEKKSDPMHIGIQISVSAKETAIEKKKKDIEKAKLNLGSSNYRMDDLVVAQIPISDSFEIFKEWKKSGMLPGGPAKMLTLEQKEMILLGVLKDIVKEENIQEMWEKISEEK